MSEDGALRAAVRRRSFPEAPRPAVAAPVAHLVRLAPGCLYGVIFFGSRRTGASGADSFSAHDLFVVVEAYTPFYRALHASGIVHRHPATLATVSRLLPPSQVSLRLDGEDGLPFHAKCSVIDVASFRRETSRARRDHFCMGRLFQPTEVVYAKDAAAADDLLDALLRALEETYRWVRPWLPPSFDAQVYGRTLLEVSLSGEIRPEPAGRAQALFAAQRGETVPVYERLLEGLAAEGELRAGPRGFVLDRAVGARERLRWRAYFGRSLARATLRWAKHVFTFEGWLDYIVHKVRRHGGGDVELSARERRMPLVFLWPRLIRYLRHKDR
jgi:hypothetical protein